MTLAADHGRQLDRIGLMRMLTREDVPLGREHEADERVAGVVRALLGGKLVSTVPEHVQQALLCLGPLAEPLVGYEVT